MRHVIVFLVAAFFTLSTLLTTHSIATIFIRDREMLTLLGVAFSILCCVWEGTKFCLLHYGARLAPSVVTADAWVGRCAIGVAVLMAMGSIAGVAHGAYAALGATKDEAQGQAQAQEQQVQRAQAQAQQAQDGARMAALTREHEALVTAGMLTRAQEVSRQMQTMSGGNKAEHVGTEIEQDRTWAQYYQSISIGRGRVGLVLCIALGVLLEMITAALVVLRARIGVASRVPVCSGVRSVRSAGASDGGNETQHVLEALRTGALLPTTRAVQAHLKCGGAKASRVLAEARERGVVR